MIETNRLILRNFKESDIDDYFEFVSQKDVLSRVDVTPYTDKQAARERLVHESQKPLRFAIVFKQNGKLIGNISLNEPKPERYQGISIGQSTKELGFLLSHDYWGMGIMPEAGKALIDYAFKNLGITKIVSGTKTPNSQSFRVQQKIGLKLHSIVPNAARWTNGQTCGYIRTTITAEQWLNKNNEK